MATRTTIQNALSIPVQEALAKLDLEQSPDHLRRICRALTTLGVVRLLDAGAPPAFVASQILEALGHELARRKADAESHTAGLIPAAEA